MLTGCDNNYCPNKEICARYDSDAELSAPFYFEADGTCRDFVSQGFEIVDTQQGPL